MRSMNFALTALAAAVLASNAYAQGVCVNDVPTPYRALDSWAQLPEGRQWVGMNTINVDRENHVWVFDRCGDKGCKAQPNMAPIYELDTSGKVLRNFGAGLFIEPHGITGVGGGNVWVVDEGKRDGTGQVTKLDSNGKVMMTLGRGPNDPAEARYVQPTSIVVAPNGDLFVADGHEADYGNARILKYTKDGKFIKAFNGSGSGIGALRATHTMAMDSAGRLFVADRGNGRIAIFDQDGKWLADWKQFGRPSGIFIDRNDLLYVSDTQSTDDKTAGPPPGYRYNPGCKQGIRVGSAKDGKVIAYIPAPDPKRRPPEGVAADAEGNIYGATTTQKTVLKYAKVNSNTSR